MNERDRVVQINKRAFRFTRFGHTNLQSIAVAPVMIRMLIIGDH